MSNILVLTNSFFPHDDANSNVLYPFLNELKKSYSVHVVCKRYAFNDKWYEQKNGYEIYRYLANKGLLFKIYRLNLDTKRKRNFFNSLIVKIFSLLRKLLLIFYLPNQSKLIKKLNKINNYKGIITITSPIQTQYDILAMKKRKIVKCKWFAFFMDPYATYIGNKKNRDFLLSKEYEIYKNCDNIFTTPEIKEDNKENILNEFCDKIIPVQISSLNIENKKSTQLFNNTKINLAYFGGLQDLNVRNPEYFYQLVNSIDDFDLQVHLFVNNFNSDNLMLIDKYKNDRIVVHDSISLEKCKDYMNSNVILINLGNKCTNQTPSKIFDYMSTGNPIISFYSINNDTSKKYLEKYSNALMIDENMSLSSNKEKIVKFIQTNSNIKLSCATLKREIGEYDSKISAKKFVDTIKKHIK